MGVSSNPLINKNFAPKFTVLVVGVSSGSLLGLNCNRGGTRRRNVVSLPHLGQYRSEKTFLLSFTSM